MIYIKSVSRNPYFNTASEEYILENFDKFNSGADKNTEDIFMLWQNEPCVYLGVNQNAYAEINLDYAKKNGINIVRRLSGGGCVYQDTGNVNFSFFSNVSDASGASDANILNFERYTKPIIIALKSLGVNAELQGRNDLVIDGAKFSGNAQCVRNTKSGKKRLLHHGTLLYDASLSKLSQVLNPDIEKIKSKGVKSVRSRVTNITEHMPENQKILIASAEQFKNYLEDYIVSQNGCKIYNFSMEDIKNIRELADNYYCTNEFIYGTNIKYSFKNKKRFDFGTVEICFNVSDFKIKDAKIYGDFFGESDINELEELLNGLPHDADEIKKSLYYNFAESEKNINRFIKGCDTETFLGLLL